MRQLICILISALVGTHAIAQGAGVDTGRSNLTIHVDKTGLFSAFAHNHTIQAPIASGRLDVEKRSITLTFNASEMKVMDPDVKDSERAEIRFIVSVFAVWTQKSVAQKRATSRDRVTAA